MKKVGSNSLNSNENFWSLGSILGVSIGIPMMLLGDQLARSYGVTTAIASIFIGNLILWILGFGVFSMNHEKNHAIDNIKKHLGKSSSILAILLFTAAFLMWYTFQLSEISLKIAQFSSFHEEWKIGAILGSIVALLSLGGFKMVKWCCILGGPLLGAVIIYYIITQKSNVQYATNIQLSYLPLVPVVMACLSGAINFPTFSRHSRSKQDSVVALAIIMIFHILFQISSIFYNTEIFSNTTQNNTTITLITIITFSITSFICVNLVNIYFVSACWEAIFPHDHGVKKYFIIGLIGNITYVYLKIENKMQYLNFVTDAIVYSMTILLLSLMINFIISNTIKNKESRINTFSGNAAWIIGCIVTVRALIKNSQDPIFALISGCTATIIFTIVSSFIEISLKSIKNIKIEKI